MLNLIFFNKTLEKVRSRGRTGETEKLCLEECYSRVIDTFGIPEPENWANRHFNELSFNIKKASKISISPSTLKRIFKKVPTSSDYVPQKATKDALAIYLGYENWNAFRASSDIQSERESSAKTSFSKSRPYLLAGLILFLIVITLIINFTSTGRGENKYNYTFTCKNMTGDAFHTASFSYNIEKLKVDSAILSFGHGENVQLKEDKHFISHYYYSPGYYPVTLKFDDEIVEDTAVYLTTEGWESFVFSGRERRILRPMKDFKPRGNGTGKLTARPRQVHKSGFDTLNLYWTMYSNIKPFKISGDNFVLETDIKNDYIISASQCNHIIVKVIGRKRNIQLYFLRKGCSNWIEVQFSEKILYGNTSDLSAFTLEPEGWQTLNMKVMDKHVTILLNNEIIYQNKYEKPIGEIMGVEFVFSGIGEVKGFNLKSPELS